MAAVAASLLLSNYCCNWQFVVCAHRSNCVRQFRLTCQWNVDKERLWQLFRGAGGGLRWHYGGQYKTLRWCWYVFGTAGIGDSRRQRLYDGSQGDEIKFVEGRLRKTQSKRQQPDGWRGICARYQLGAVQLSMEENDLAGSPKYSRSTPPSATIGNGLGSSEREKRWRREQRCICGTLNSSQRVRVRLFRVAVHFSVCRP